MLWLVWCRGKRVSDITAVTHINATKINQNETFNKSSHEIFDFILTGIFWSFRFYCVMILSKDKADNISSLSRNDIWRSIDPSYSCCQSHRHYPAASNTHFRYLPNTHSAQLLVNISEPFQNETSYSWVVFKYVGDIWERGENHSRAGEWEHIQRYLNMLSKETYNTTIEGTKAVALKHNKLI